jgi:hypothetical protein
MPRGSETERSHRRACSVPGRWQSDELDHRHGGSDDGFGDEGFVNGDVDADERFSRIATVSARLPAAIGA